MIFRKGLKRPVLGCTESEWERLEDIDAVTGQPRVDDVLLYALPMCAPYGAVQNHKYKAKLNPGTMKKARAYCPTVVLRHCQREGLRSKKIPAFDVTCRAKRASKH